MRTKWSKPRSYVAKRQRLRCVLGRNQSVDILAPRRLLQSSALPCLSDDTDARAVTVRDMPVVQACGIVFAGVYVILNMLADIGAILANPRLMHPK